MTITQRFTVAGASLVAAMTGIALGTAIAAAFGLPTL